MQMDITSDATCPWCFSGKHRLDRALALRTPSGRTTAAPNSTTRWTRKRTLSHWEPWC